MCTHFSYESHYQQGSLLLMLILRYHQSRFDLKLHSLIVENINNFECDQDIDFNTRDCITSFQTSFWNTVANLTQVVYFSKVIHLKRVI